MTPLSFEWHWDLGHFIFFGISYTVWAIIFGTLIFQIVKTGLDIGKGHGHAGHHDEEEHQAGGNAH